VAANQVRTLAKGATKFAPHTKLRVGGWPGRDIPQGFRVDHNRKAIIPTSTTHRNMEGAPRLAFQSLGLEFDFSFRSNKFPQLIRIAYFIILLTVITFRATMPCVYLAPTRTARPRNSWLSPLF